MPRRQNPKKPAPRSRIDKTGPFIVAARVTELRRARNLTQFDVCAATGLGLSRYSEIENGKAADQRVSTLLALANLFDCSTDFLLGRRNDP